MSALRTIYKWWVAVLLVGVILQIAFAGYGAFYAADKVDDATIDEDTFNNGFDLHTGFGYLIFLAAILLLILALVARPGKRRVWHSATILVLVFVQILLAYGGYGVPAVFGALHPLNAFLILGAVGSLAAIEWKGGRMRMPEAAPSVTTPPG